ncbi:unnamed protein product [Agarophyton chilense]
MAPVPSPRVPHSAPMYVINASPTHCFTAGRPHRDPRRCLNRIPSFHFKRASSSCKFSPAVLRSATPSSSNHSSNDSSSDTSFSDPLSSEPLSSNSSAHNPDRLAKSRAVGQSHRDSERDHIIYLLSAIVNGRLENSLLYFVFSYAYKRDRMLRFGQTHCIARSQTPCDHHLWQLPSDCTEDSLAHLRPLLYPLSQPTQVMLSQRMMSGATASSLLELLMNRRNMWGTTHAILINLCHPEGNRRRRRPYRAATTTDDADAIVQLATRLYSREICHDYQNKHAVADYVQQRLGNLAMAAYHIDHIEATTNPVYSLTSHATECDYLPLPPSPTTPHTAEFGSPVKMRRIEGARRCTRCGVVKVAGSGHGRSKCPDGLSISSHLPYQPPSRLFE